MDTSNFLFKHVKRIHELRIWALSQERTVCTVHLGVENKSADLDILHDISRNLKTQFGFTEVTGTFIIRTLEKHHSRPACENVGSVNPGVVEKKPEKSNWNISMPRLQIASSATKMHDLN